jgi:hypothetical protein
MKPTAMPVTSRSLPAPGPEGPPIAEARETAWAHFFFFKMSRNLKKIESLIFLKDSNMIFFVTHSGLMFVICIVSSAYMLLCYAS